MGGVERIDGGPRSAIVVGAGIVGLSTAWFLQERGVDVTVVDRTGVAAGASWGNAGWISPALTLPLNSPGVLRYGLRSLTRPGRPAAHPVDRRLRTRGLPDAVRRQLPAIVVEAGGARQRAASTRNAIEAFDVLVANGVDAPVTDAPITAVFRSTEEAERMMRELRAARKRRADNVCHRTGRRGVARTSAPGIAGDHRRAEHQRSALRRPAADSCTPWASAVVDRGATMRTAGSSRRVQLRQRGRGVSAQRQAADRRRRGDRHRRMAIPAGGHSGARAGAGRSRLLVHRARGPPHTRPDLPARRAGGVHALPRRTAGVGHHGVPRPA